MKIDSSILKSLSVYSVANILNAAIPFLLLPILTNHLKPADFGLISMFQLILGFTIPFSGINTDGAISRQYFNTLNNKLAFKYYLSNAFLIVCVSSIILSILYYFFGSTVSSYTDFPVDWLWVIMVCSFSQNVLEILLSLLQVQQKAMQFSILRITKTFVEMGLSVLLILYVKNSWESRIEAQLIASILFLVLAIFLLLKMGWVVIKISKKDVIDLLRFGIPLIPHVIGAVVISMIDRMFITKMVGLEETGLYSVGFQVGQVISLIQTSFNQAWVPYFYEKLTKRDFATNLKIVKFTYIYFIVMLVLVALLSIVTPFIFEWFLGKDYSNAIKYVFWIGLGFAFNGMYKMVVNYFFYIKETYWVSILTFITAAINVGLNFVLIRLNGSVGAAQATAISFLIQFILVWLLSAKKYKMPWLFFIVKHNKLN